MLRIELSPNPSHCIETVAKEEYWSSVNKFMAGEQEDKELQQRIELLKAFLESMDFGKLRRESEKHLMQGEKVKFIICWKENRPSYDMVAT
jgi:hypothetical protein